MKKIWLVLLLVLITGCNEKVEENPFKNIGYNDNEIEIIESKPKFIKNYIEENGYNKKYIDIISNDNFVDEYFNIYISLLDQEVSDIFYIVNNNYYSKDITYDYIVLSFMKSKYYIHKNLNEYLDYYSKLKFDSEDQNKINYTITAVNSMVNYPFYQNTIETDLSKGYLMIVNKYHYLNSNYVPYNLVTINSKYGKTQPLEKTTYEAFMKMVDDAKKDGMNMYALSPYRSYNTQANLYQTYVNRDGKALADTYSARAGHSEHQTGLAVDIARVGGNLNGFEYTAEARWLKDNAYKYGFILRYPKGKEWITGYDFEPWHYRYVGLEVAKEIYEQDITFEEYYAYYIEK